LFKARIIESPREKYTTARAIVEGSIFKDYPGDRDEDKKPRLFDGKIF